MEVTDVAVEIFLTPLFVRLLPLQVALSVQLQTSGLICRLSVQVTSPLASCFLLRVFTSPPGAVPARSGLLAVMPTVMAGFVVI